MNFQICKSVIFHISLLTLKVQPKMKKTLLSVIFAVMSLTTYAEDPVREIELS